MTKTTDLDDFIKSDEASKVLPKILIVGILSEQQQLLVEEFKDKIAFTFAKENLEYHAGCQDYVVINTKHMKDSKFSFEKTRIVGKQIRLLIHRGGMTRLKEKLEALIQEAKSSRSCEIDSEV